MTTTTSHPLVERIQGEFEEMPGLKLTQAQAQRLFGLGRAECEWLLSILTDSRFLARTPDGSYIRASAAH